MQRHPDSHTRVPPMTVTMVDGIVVIRPRADVAHIDLDATGAVLNCVAAAISCGETVQIELGDGTKLDSCAANRWTRSVADDHVEGDATVLIARVVSPGCIRLDAAHETWTLDIGRGRFCRSDRPVEPKFVGAENWTSIAAVWVTTGRSTLLTETGTYLSAPTRWAADHTPAEQPHSIVAA